MIEQLRKSLAKSNPQTFAAAEFRGEGSASLPYRLFSPAQKGENGKWPLVLVLHGGTPRGNDNLAHITGNNPAVGAGWWTRPEVQKEHPCFVLAPQCPGGSEAWTPELPMTGGEWRHSLKPAPAMTLVMNLLDHLVSTLPVDPDRLYVVGASMGGYGTWDLLVRRPDMFAAAVPVCGGLAKDSAAKICRVPVWIFHGGADEVVPVALSRRAFVELRQAGGQPRYTEFAEAGHHVSVYAWTHPQLVQWLFGQVKKRQLPGEP